jgi:tRNA dimethylallyltransferase
MTPLQLPPGLLGVCLAGPTASGKSALAMALARLWPVEIISVDSALVYRGMDIGTAKPSAEDQALVPHHLIDIMDPLHSYSAARFAADAQRIAADVRARHKLPLLVGGTMLYFKALRDGISPMPQASAELRAQIDAEAALVGWPALHQQLAQVDPTTAARLAPRDAQRIQRALEVWRSSGRTLSAWHAQDRAAHATANPQAADAAWPMLSLEPLQRSWLHRRIEQRLEQMVAAGFVAEVQALRQRGDLHAELPALRCVGYRQAWQALEQTSAHGSAEAAFAALGMEGAVAATRQLAKRQLTWLRSVPARSVVACEASDGVQQAVQWLAQKVSQPC